MRWVFLGVAALASLTAFLRSEGRKALVLFASLFFLIGMFVLGIGVEKTVLSLQARTWPVVEGVVLASEVQEVQDSDEDRSYRPVVQYRYTYRGKTYLSRRIWVGGSLSGSAFWAQNIVSRYPPGKTVSVRVRPDDPSFSVLETGFVPTALFLLLFGLVFTLMGGGFMGFVTLGHRLPPQDSPAWFLTGFGVLWLLMTIPLALESVTRIRQGTIDAMAAVGIILVLIGIGVLGAGSIMLLRRFQGATIRIMVDEPLHPGEPFSARIVFPPRPFDRVRVRLRCSAQITQRTSDGWTTETLPVWSTEQEISSREIPRGPGGVHLNVSFTLPEDLPPSGTHPLSEATRAQILEQFNRMPLPRALRDKLPPPEALLPQEETTIWTLEVRVERRGLDAVHSRILQVAPKS